MNIFQNLSFYNCDTVVILCYIYVNTIQKIPIRLRKKTFTVNFILKIE